MRYTLRTLLPLAAVCAVTLAACGGGGGDGGEPADPQPSDPTVTDPSLYSAGPYAINGIDRIPQSMVKLTRQEMQRKFVIGDYDEEHAQQVGTIACQSYIQSGDCDNHAGRFISADGTIRMETGSSPFTKVVALSRSDWASLLAFQEIAKMPAVRIVTSTAGGNDAAVSISDSYLTIHSVGNGSGNISWYDDFVVPADKVKIAAAIRENRLIYTAGWDRDSDGNYIRHRSSDSCRGDDIREGCVWTQFDFHYGGGTSLSVPQFAAALASVLAVAPDTTPENLAKLGKAWREEARRGD